MYASMNWVNIGSDNGLSPGRRHAIIWTNADILLIRPQGTYFNEILFKMQTKSFKITHLNMSSEKWRPFCPEGDELIDLHQITTKYKKARIMCIALVIFCKNMGNGSTEREW